MRPKTFPAAPYVGNTRQRLQEIKEGLKQPAKLVSQALHGSSSRTEGGRGADCKSGKDTASRQQQLRPPQKFTNYQNALREIRKSLMPFANESGPSSGSGHPAGAGEVNRQMLQDLVNAGCDQVSQWECVCVCVCVCLCVCILTVSCRSVWSGPGSENVFGYFTLYNVITCDEMW